MIVWTFSVDILGFHIEYQAAGTPETELLNGVLAEAIEQWIAQFDEGETK